MSAKLWGVACALGVVLCGSLDASVVFVQTNLTSDVPGLAANTDPNLKNSWGMSFGPTTPFWVSDQVTNVSTLYNGAGVPQALVVSTPPGPTGQVFNGVSNAFLLAPGDPARFIFASLSGAIAGWNPAVDATHALTQFTDSGAVFTGLTSATSGGNQFLYAADFKNAKIDVLDSSFKPTTVAGGFTDPNLPAGYSPYNIQNVGGNLYVEYDLVNPTTHMPAHQANTGVVDVFDPTGTLVQRLVTGSHLNSPWGVTMAPATFGGFGGDVLVGNFGDGTISAFNPTTGAFAGMITDASGNPIVNSGLWALSFRAPGSGFDPNALFITAGINNQADGLFAEIQAVPEPATLVMLLGGMALLWRRRQSKVN